MLNHQIKPLKLLNYKTENENFLSDIVTTIVD